MKQMAINWLSQVNIAISSKTTPIFILTRIRLYITTRTQSKVKGSHKSVHQKLGHVIIEVWAKLSKTNSTKFLVLSKEIKSPFPTHIINLGQLRKLLIRKLIYVICDQRQRVLLLFWSTISITPHNLRSGIFAAVGWQTCRSRTICCKNSQLNSSNQ